MRDSRNITIYDDGDEIKFKLTKMGAWRAQRWLVDAGISLVGTGIISRVGQGGAVGVSDIIGALLEDGLSSLGNLKGEEVERLVADLIHGTALKLTGRGVVEMTAHEIENTFSSLPALFELEKQCLEINFGFFAQGGALTGGGPRQGQGSQG